MKNNLICLLLAFACLQFHSTLEAKPKKICAESLAALAAEESISPEEQRANVVQAAKTYANYVKNYARIPTAEEFTEYLEISSPEFSKIYGKGKNLGFRAIVERAQSFHADAFQKLKNRMIRTYISIARQKGEHPTLQEIAAKFLRETEDLETLFGKNKIFKDLSEFEKAALTENPKAFEDVRNEDVYSPERRAALLEALKTADTFIFTSVMAGKGLPIDEGFFEAIKTWHKKTKGPVFIRSTNNRTQFLDARLLDYDWIHIVTDDIELSPWMKLNTIEVTPKQVIVTTGLHSHWQRNQTQFIAGPKIEVKSVAMSNREIPHMVVTTGSLSEARYSEKNAKVIQRRQSRKAADDHFLGGIVFERMNAGSEFLGLEGAGDFHWRHIEYIPEKEGFLDRDIFYSADGVENTKIINISLGDTHAMASMDQTLLEPIMQMIEKFNPKMITLHDFLDAETINHHLAEQRVTRAKMAQSGDLDLSKELDQVASVINAILARFPKLDIVLAFSNHPAWLYRWIQEKEFQDDPTNAALGAELFAVMAKGEDPLEYAFNKTPIRFDSDRETVRLARIQDPSRVKFLPREAPSLKVGPNNRLAEVGDHGHQGPDGKPGSVKTFHMATHRGIFGHLHADARKNGATQIGTNTETQLGYTAGGASSWTQSVGLVGENGEIQVYMFKFGEFYRGDSTALMSPDQFWFTAADGTSYPRVLKVQEPGAGGEIIDQYSQPPQ